MRRNLARFAPKSRLNDEDPGFHLGAKQNHVWKPLICALHGMVAGRRILLLKRSGHHHLSQEAMFFDPHTTYGMTSALEPIGLAQ